MRGNERVSHFASLAKYAVAFFRMSRSSVTRDSSRFNRRNSASLSSPPEGRENFFFHAYSEYGRKHPAEAVGACQAATALMIGLRQFHGESSSSLLAG